MSRDEKRDVAELRRLRREDPLGFRFLMSVVKRMADARKAKQRAK